MSRDLLVLIVLASVLAFPLAWFGLDHWLQDFANRISIDWWMFLLTFSLGGIGGCCYPVEPDHFGCI